jgi:hypothetical protein
MVAPHTPDEMVLPIKEAEDKITAILTALERDHGVRIHAVEVNSNALVRFATTIHLAR